MVKCDTGETRGIIVFMLPNGFKKSATNLAHK